MTPLLVDTTEAAGYSATVLAVPPAGAGVAFYAPWISLLSPTFRVTVLRLPGREDLWDEDPLEDPDEILRRVTGEVAAAPVRNLVIFGCCTGGLLAYELAHRLIRARAAAPIALVLNGTATPVAMEDMELSKSPAEYLRDYYERASGEPFPDEIWELAEPRIRADLAIVERCEYDDSALAIPIVTARGETDDIISLNETRRWARYAGAGVANRELPGGHFLMNDCPRELSQELFSVLRGYGEPGTAPGQPRA